MKLFEQIEGTAERTDHRGRGVVAAGGKDVSVPFAVPGDRLRVELIKRSKGALRGRIVEILSPSSDRIAPRCRHAGSCGGCPWQMMDYPAQLEWKKKLVNRAFESAGLDLRVDSVEGSPEIFYHRNRMDYVIAETERGAALGLKTPGRWWDTLDLETCFLLSEDAVRVMAQIREWMKQWNLPAWNLKTHSGLIRYCVIREGKFTGERMATVVTGPGTLSEDVIDDLRARLSGLCTSLFWGINPKITDLSSSEELHLLHGKDRLTERINGFAYAIRPNSFFQTNSRAAGLLQETVLEFAAPSPSETVLDLYCGVGFFSLPLARRAKRLIGVELDPEAIELAASNAKTNGIANAEFQASDAREFLNGHPAADAVVLDPPRSGLHPRVLESLVSTAPSRLVYVSCNYQALVRELPAFLRVYAIRAIRAIDMFPHTPHVELVLALLKR